MRAFYHMQVVETTHAITDARNVANGRLIAQPLFAEVIDGLGGSFRRQCGAIRCGLLLRTPLRRRRILRLTFARRGKLATGNEQELASCQRPTTWPGRRTEPMLFANANHAPNPVPSLT